MVNSHYAIRVAGILLSVVAAFPPQTASGQVRCPKKVEGAADAATPAQEDKSLLGKLEEVQKIRKLLNLDIYKGTYLDPTQDKSALRIDAQDFSEAFLRVAKQASADAHQARLGLRIPQQIRPAAAARPLPADTDHYFLSLIDTAHELDGRAHQFETQSRWDEADQLRKLARKLRQQARRQVNQD